MYLKISIIQSSLLEMESKRWKHKTPNRFKQIEKVVRERIKPLRRRDDRERISHNNFPTFVPFRLL